MPRTIEEKQEITEELARLLEEAGAVYLTDFRGLDVEAMTDLRSRLREEGIGYRVAKNTLMSRALDGLDFPEMEDHLEGPTGLVLGGRDPVMPAKIVTEFAEEHDDRPSVKVGVVDRQVVSREDVEQLAELPPREELLASITGSLGAPIAGIVGVLEGLLRDIGHMAHEAAKKRESGED